ncbi:hypothetical protein DN069_10100 [Streptacidiphilus pinicola]|uniref:DUF1684 domain-containing protein n=1 Tax=Streptacidiphilus pinicola TaxID=2219663 RepID=A0A2X0K992_9ACTN|nr:DUF1684 domain-containing protein [Streptacidiphilus pinicola]RAG85845.1 hypothetical protein DN069_10100 [Streptacidiphilus pinicola]
MESAVEAWKSWRDERVVSARAPYGPLSLTGTHWLDAPRRAGRELPGHWLVDRPAGNVRLTAARHDGVSVDDTPLDGTVRLCPDGGTAAPRVTHGGRRLELITRTDGYAVRVFDPAAPARTLFAGIDAFPYDPGWVVPARFVAFPSDHTVPLAHSDGRTRPAVFAGTLTFRRGGAAATVTVQRAADGVLSLSLSDATRSAERNDFRVVEVLAPDRAGWTVVDFNRAQLPPSAFAGHYLCPLPPAGNKLPFPVRAGERRLLAHH